LSPEFEATDKEKTRRPAWYHRKCEPLFSQWRRVLMVTLLVLMEYGRIASSSDWERTIILAHGGQIKVPIQVFV
jgi:hypothetical protein